jgi:hypothetical protein
MAASQEKKSQEPAKAPDFRTIVVVLSYPGYDPMTFWLRRSMGQELRAVQREFYGKTQDEQNAQQHKYRVDFLAELTRRQPEGVPDYPVELSPKDAFKQYFGDEEMDDMIDHIWVAYQNQIYPKELTSSTSG